MIKFEKVSYEQYASDRLKLDCSVQEDTIRQEYENIKLPRRGTSGSAGYDFYLPYNLKLDARCVLDAEEAIVPIYNYETLPTGIRFVTDRSDIVLLCVPRSGLGFKNGLRLSNTLGVIDSDYCKSDNEGHIMARFNVEKDLGLPAGKAFMQGVIVPFLIVDDDDCTEIRNGGFGSTKA